MSRGSVQSVPISLDLVIVLQMQWFLHSLVLICERTRRRGKNPGPVVEPLMYVSYARRFGCFEAADVAVR